MDKDKDFIDFLINGVLKEEYDDFVNEYPQCIVWLTLNKVFSGGLKFIGHDASINFQPKADDGKEYGSLGTKITMEELTKLYHSDYKRLILNKKLNKIKQK